MCNQVWKPVTLFFFLTFYSETIIYSQELTKIVHRVPWTLHPASSSNYSTISKHWYNTQFASVFLCTDLCVCVTLCNLIQCINLHNHHHNQDTELFHLHKGIPLCYPFIVQADLPGLRRCPLATSHLFSNSILLSFWEFNINGITHYITFEIGFIHKAQYPWDPTK